MINKIIIKKLLNIYNNIDDIISKNNDIYNELVNDVELIIGGNKSKDIIKISENMDHMDHNDLSDEIVKNKKLIDKIYLDIIRLKRFKAEMTYIYSRLDTKEKFIFNHMKQNKTSAEIACKSYESISNVYRSINLIYVKLDNIVKYAVLINV